MLYTSGVELYQLVSVTKPTIPSIKRRNAGSIRLKPDASVMPPQYNREYPALV